MELVKTVISFIRACNHHARVLIDVSFLKSSNKEIKKMNIGKIGTPFQYSDSYVWFLAFLDKN